MSRQLCTWPRERHYPDSCHRKPQLGRGLRLRVTTFPGGRGPRPLCSLLGPAYGGVGGAGRAEASSTSSPLSASPSFACCILFPFFLSLPFVTKSCRQPCGPVRLPQGGQPQSGCLTRGCGHSETRVLLHPEDGRANPQGPHPPCELGLRWAPGPAPCCPLSPGSPCSAFEPPLKCLFPREAPRCGESGELRSQCTAPPCRSAHREEVAVRLSAMSPPLQTDSLVTGEGSA